MPIPENPTIKLAFTGLLAFCFDNDRRTCQVGILRGVPDHNLTFKVFKVSTESKKEFDFTAKARVRDVFLNVNKAENKGVELYKNGPFTRDDTDDPNDFRWLVDIEGQEFHGESLGVEPGILTPSFFVDDGLFYSAFLSPADIMRNGEFEQRDTSVATVIGANIYLAEGEEALLSFGDDDPFLMRNGETDDNGNEITYKIQIFEHCVACLEPNIGGDFLHYYDAFKRRADGDTLVDIPPAERFSVLEAAKPGSSGAPESRQHPCGPAFGSKISGFV
jgi:hypothetical protein